MSDTKDRAREFFKDIVVTKQNAIWFAESEVAHATQELQRQLDAEEKDHLKGQLADEQANCARLLGNLLDMWDGMANDTQGFLRETETGFYRAVEAIRESAK